MVSWIGTESRSLFLGEAKKSPGTLHNPACWHVPMCIYVYTVSILYIHIYIYIYIHTYYLYVVCVCVATRKKICLYIRVSIISICII